MRPRRTLTSTRVFRLAGGTEDNDLWVRDGEDSSGHHTIASVWELTPQERDEVAHGANVELMVWADRTPPVSLAVTHEPLGKRRPVQGITDLEKALLALAAATSSPLVVEEDADLELLFDEGWIRNERDIGDEYMTVLTAEGRESVAARIRFALSKLGGAADA